MTVVVKAKKNDQLIHFEICPNDICTPECNVEVHRILEYPVQAPEWENAKGHKIKFKGDWVEHCMNEAMLLVQQENTSEEFTEIENLVGRTLNDKQS